MKLLTKLLAKIGIGKDTAGDEGKNWYKDKYQYVLVQRNILAVITLMALFGAAMSVFAVMQLTPHKSVEPFVIQIDEKSGIVERVDPVTRSEFTADEAIDRYFVAKYIRARESFISSVFKDHYNVVRVMSEPFVFGQYRQFISEQNPDSPAAILKIDGTRAIEFKSLVFIKKNDNPNGIKVAQARITLTDDSRRFPVPMVYHNIVTVTYRYSKLNLNEKERYLNPLGFLVTEYTVEQEVIE